MLNKLSVIFHNSSVKMDSLKNISKARCRLVIHSVFLIHHVISCVAITAMDFTKVTNQRLLDIRDFSDRYFTGWNFAFQMLFLALAIMCDVSEIIPETVDKIWPSHKLIKRLAIARDFIFMTFVFPFTIFVCLLFWSVYNYDRELVLPRVCDTLVSPILNHALHTHIVAVVCAELVMSRKRKPRGQFRRLFCLGIIVFAYFIVLMWTYLATGRWIYAILGLFNWTERFIFLATIVISIYVLYFVGGHVTEIIGGSLEVVKHNKGLKAKKNDEEKATNDNLRYSTSDANSGDMQFECFQRKNNNNECESFFSKLTGSFVSERSDIRLSELLNMYTRLKN